MNSAPLSADARRSLFLYNLFFPIVFLCLLPGFLIRMLRRGSYRENFGQRLGLYSAQDRERFAGGGWIWIHSISVGETFIALKLARQLHADDPTARIILSATTTTGLALIREAASDWLAPLYNPVDFLPIIRRAFAVLRPRRIILIEGEAWPNLVAESRRRRIPIALANARLSPRSEARFRRFRSFTAPIFCLLDFIAVPEPEDLPRWRSLGVPDEKLHCTGSIKFDYASTADAPSRAAHYRTLLAPLAITEATPILLAGSTHDGEEKILAETLIALRPAFPDLHLLIAPRHVERTPAILRELAPLGLRLTLRTALPLSQPAPCDILLIDTTGELRDWYHLATIVFIGKTLTATGGQNPAEAAILGKPVVFGPHMENFAALTTHLLTHEAALQIPAATLVPTLHALLTDPARREALGAHARFALAVHQGATCRTAALFD